MQGLHINSSPLMKDERNIMTPYEHRSIYGDDDENDTSAQDVHQIFN